MNERYEPLYGPFENIKMSGPRGRIEKFILGKDLVKASLDPHPGQDIYLVEASYVHWRGLKHRHEDGFLGDQISVDEIRSVFELSGTDERSGLYTAITLSRDLHDVELETGIYEGQWGPVFMTRPTID
jgi:hypothetical protein